MNYALQWREAERRDRSILQSFTCTTPERRDFRRRPLPHPTPWERDVEAGLRAQTPPVGGGFLGLGEDDQGLAAVVLLWDLGRNDDVCVIKLAAVAVDVRCKSRGYAADAMNFALDAAANRGFGQGFDRVFAFGYVDPRNDRSRRMNVRAGLTLQGLEPSGEHEEWARELELPPELA